MQLKIRQVAKTMGKLKDNMCKQALIAEKETCNREDLLTQCMNICKKLNIQCVTEGEPNKEEKLRIKKVIWRENDKEIREGLDNSIVMPKYKKQQNHLRRMNLPDARTCFRFRSKITNHIKGNTSSIYRDNMQGRYCMTGFKETQEHLEKCKFARQWGKSGPKGRKETHDTMEENK